MLPHAYAPECRRASSWRSGVKLMENALLVQVPYHRTGSRSLVNNPRSTA